MGGAGSSRTPRPKISTIPVPGWIREFAAGGAALLAQVLPMSKLMVLWAAIGCCGVLGAASAPQPRPFSDFRPSAHGFTFTNSFSGSPLPGALGAIAPGIGPSHFGLCGGMSTAAADYFLAQRIPPARPKPPLKGDPLFDYLQSRQVDSLGGGLKMVPVFAAWMAAPDDGWLGARHATALTIGAVTEALKLEKPVVLGLVRVKGGQGKPIWENHQVLATRSEQGEDGSVILHIYDPNYPKRDDVTMTCTPAVVGAVTLPGEILVHVPLVGVTCSQRVGGRGVSNIRGLFAMPYAANEPPALLQDPKP